FLSSPANPLNEKISSSFPKWLIVRLYSFSKASSLIGWLLEPQSTKSSDTSSLTIKRSLDERPVYFPVVALIAPVEDITPSSLDNTFSTSIGIDKFSCRIFLLEMSFIVVLCSIVFIITYLPFHYLTI